MIDLGCETSVCPFCGAACLTRTMTVFFSDKSQSVVRKVFSDADSAKYPERRKKSSEDRDPMSTLIYRCENASGVLERLIVLADGLTRIKGQFTVGDVEELFPGEGERMIKMMISGGIIIELGYGEYKAV
ncbi:MAG: hypothetical protein FWG58_03970 [Methanomassiliicoccaceae archaeon]|nr:hypothetical protein [Methanomassiliicoccaceae archaeon]